MGIGKFDPATHKFNMVVSLQYHTDAADLISWQGVFQRASEVLFNATNGKHQLGNINVCLDSAGGAIADMWILGKPGTAASGGYSVLGTTGVHMTVNYDERLPLVIVHEIGHYVYGLRDEYLRPGAVPGLCLGHDRNGDPNSDACIMEATETDGDVYNATTKAWNHGTITRFCSSDHNGTSPYQNLQLGVSCWQTMTTAYADLLPTPVTPQEVAPAGIRAGQVSWVVLNSTERFVLVIDSSSSMRGDKLDEAKFGADWWVDSALIGDQLAIVSLSDTVTTDILHQINSNQDRSPLHTRIGSIIAGGGASIGSGLRAAYQILSSAGPRTVTESIVLLTDGRQNTDEGPDEVAPDDVLPDLTTRGVRVYTIGIGSDVEPVLLQHIATATGGTYYVA